MSDNTEHVEWKPISSSSTPREFPAEVCVFGLLCEHYTAAHSFANFHISFSRALAVAKRSRVKRAINFHGRIENKRNARVTFTIFHTVSVYFLSSLVSRSPDFCDTRKQYVYACRVRRFSRIRKKSIFWFRCLASLLFFFARFFSFFCFATSFILAIAYFFLNKFQWGDRCRFPCQGHFKTNIRRLNSFTAVIVLLRGE